VAAYSDAEVAESPRASLQSWSYAGSNPALGSNTSPLAANGLQVERGSGIAPFTLHRSLRLRRQPSESCRAAKAPRAPCFEADRLP
jgi:hypothetical protein